MIYMFKPFYLILKNIFTNDTSNVMPPRCLNALKWRFHFSRNHLRTLICYQTFIQLDYRNEPFFFIV